MGEIGQRVALLFQMVLVLGTSGLIAAMPPAQGAMLLVSATGEPAGRIFEQVRSTGARLAGRGPISASIIVVGDRRLIMSRALATGIFPVAAKSPTCVGTAETRSS